MRAKIISSGRCCRYSWRVVEGVDILHFFLNNEKLFNDSWKVFAFNNNKELIPQDATLENPDAFDQAIVFNGGMHKFLQWIDKVKWDEIGTWFIYSVPTEIPSDEMKPIALHREEMPLLACDGYQSYFMLPAEWEFIHKIKPDVVIIRQPDTKLLVAALDRVQLYKCTKRLPSIIDGDHPF